MTKQKSEGMLSPYRVLDLTDEKGLFCGKLFGDLGADVIKIERPGGDAARNLGPFYHDEIDPEKSLFWWAFNTSKRGVTLDIEATDGQDIFKKLVASADLIIESFPPGYMAKLGLGYSVLERINPGIIMVSITPFGQTGPYKDYQTTDITAWAMGGYLYPLAPGSIPVRVSHHSQAYLHAGAAAAEGAMIALHYRNMTGTGQQVDVSIHESVAQVSNQITTIPWDAMQVIYRREGPQVFLKFRSKSIWPCRDGYIVFTMRFGPLGYLNLPFIRWASSEGILDTALSGIDWLALDPDTTPPGVRDEIEKWLARVFMTRTKAELFAGALKYDFMLYPVATTADIVKSEQLAARCFWVAVAHPELGTSVTYPGAFAKASVVPPRISRRAPLIGEHNQEILEQELSLSREEILKLRQSPYRAVPLNEHRHQKTPPTKPLEGIKIADFAWAGVGPMSTRVFADYGAEVIKIEGRLRPDPSRAGAPFKDGIAGLDRSSIFLQWNTSKLSLALNLAHPRGLDIAKRLVAWADIVTESFAGGVMQKLGLGYEELKKVKPDTIMLSTCMQGQTGPHCAHPGFGLTLTALSGFNHITGWPDREPENLYTYTDFIGPHFNVLAILAALDYRDRTGKGQYLDVSQYENGVHFLAPLILDYVVNGRVANRTGNRYPSAAPHGAYRCRGDDRWGTIAVFTAAEWRNFVGAIGNPAWASSPKFITLKVRKDNEDELDRLVEEWTINHTAEEVMSLLQGVGVPAGVVQTGEDLLEHDPQLQHRHFFRELDHPEVGKYRAPAHPFVLSKSPCAVSRAPLLGEHNEYVLREIIGLSAEEIAGLATEGVIE